KFGSPPARCVGTREGGAAAVVQAPCVRQAATSNHRTCPQDELDWQTAACNRDVISGLTHEQRPHSREAEPIDALTIDRHELIPHSEAGLEGRGCRKDVPNRDRRESW